MDDQEIILTINRKRIVRAVLFSVLTVSALALVSRFLRLAPEAITVSGDMQAYFLEIFIDGFAVNVKSNMMTYFVSFILLASNAGLFFLIANLKVASDDGYSAAWRAFGWMFVYLSVVRAAVLPEKTTSIFAFWTDRDGWFEARWVFAAFVYLLILILFWKFIVHFERGPRTVFIVSNAMYFLGVFGVELFSGRYTTIYAVQTPGLTIITAAALIVEFAGLTLLLSMLLRYIEAFHPEIRLSSRGSATIDG